MRISPVSILFLLLSLAGSDRPDAQPAFTERASSGSQALTRQPEPCGTWQVLQAKAGLGLQWEPAARPDSDSLMINSAHFRVHYNDHGLDEYADSILAAAEKAYATLITDLGYITPPSDGTNGGDSRTDIYIRPYTVFPHLGRTMPEDWRAVPYPNSYTSYIELVDTLGLDLLLTTTAHEFFHVIQVGYDLDEKVSFLELTAVWLEDVVYDDINAYRRYLPNFFSRPEKALFSHIYSNVVWAIYLAENFGNGVIREIFETAAATSGDDILPASESVLSGYGTSFADQFVTFTRWNFYTGARDDGLHYQEGTSFPLVEIERTYDCLPVLNYVIGMLSKPGKLACNYYLFHGNAHTDTLRVDLIPEWWATSILTSTRFFPGETSTIQFTYQPSTSGPVPYNEPRWPEADSLLLIYNIDSSILSSNSYGFSVYPLPTEPPTPSYVLILDRDGCRRPFDGINDDFGSLAGQDYAYAAALAEQSIRFALSDTIPADLSRCDAIFVIGGYDGEGVDLQTAELETLMTFMDRGGDVCLESNRLGDWIDPAQGSPTASEEAFWNYFGCDFLPGDTMTTGNVTAWQTPAGSALGAFSFNYDGGSPADDFVGELVPTTADTLAVDQSGRVRAVFRAGVGESFRIHSTVLLGASTGTGIGSSRESYLYRILEIFESTVSALAVSHVELSTSGGRVILTGTIEGYTGEPLSLVRTRPAAGANEVRLPVVVRALNGAVQFEVSDIPPAGYTYAYRLEAGTGGTGRVLWQGKVTVDTSTPALKLVYPNPSRGAFSLVVESAETSPGWFRIYNAAGRQIYAQRRVLSPGRNEIRFEGLDGSGHRLASGVYFIRLETPAASFQKKIIVLR